MKTKNKTGYFGIGWIYFHMENGKVDRTYYPVENAGMTVPDNWYVCFLDSGVQFFEWNKESKEMEFIAYLSDTGFIDGGYVVRGGHKVSD